MQRVGFITPTEVMDVHNQWYAAGITEAGSVAE